MIPEIAKIEEFFNKHEDVFKEISGLTYHILKDNLEEAVKYNRGYYKNDKGEYLYLKGIEVTNDTGNLCRMGYNGEDRGVWVHFCSVTDKKVSYVDVPICMFKSKFDPRFTGDDELMKPTTKEDFDNKVKETISNIISDYEQKREPSEYLSVLNEFESLWGEFEKECKEGGLL